MGPFTGSTELTGQARPDFKTIANGQKSSHENFFISQMNPKECLLKGWLGMVGEKMNNGKSAGDQLVLCYSVI